VTESKRVADALDAGGIPWRLVRGFPRNVRSGKPFGGISPILLQIPSDDALCCGSPWWGTIADWASVGSKVPSGVGVWVPSCSSPLHGMQLTDQACEPPLPVEDTDAVFSGIIKGLGVKMEFGVDSTCKYIGSEDKIRIPHRWMFEIGPGGPLGWFDVLGHELFHATEPRLRWDGHPDVSELRAEIGSGYLCGLLGVKPLPRHLARHHDAHVGRWIRLMKADPQLMLKVCGDVTETVAYLLRFAGIEVSWHDATLETTHVVANSTD
jgi:hypothetical protein